jgi:4-hydroxy-2-oxoheptanedioate aldolase
MLVALIEDVEAVENLQSILSVDNIDVFLIGSADLAADLGHAGEFNHPDVIAAIDKCIAEIVAAGKNVAAGTSADNVDERVDQGVKFLLSTHRPWITRGAREYFAKVAAKLG